MNIIGNCTTCRAKNKALFPKRCKSCIEGLTEMPYHNRCERPVMFCECDDKYVKVKYNWETGLYCEVAK